MTLRPIQVTSDLPKAPGFAAHYLRDAEGRYFFQIVDAVLQIFVGGPIGPYPDLSAAIDAARALEPGKEPQP